MHPEKFATAEPKRTRKWYRLVMEGRSAERQLQCHQDFKLSVQEQYGKTATCRAKRLECAVSRRFRFLNPRFARAYPRKKRRDTAHSKRFARFGGLARLSGVGLYVRAELELCAAAAMTGRLLPLRLRAHLDTAS